MQRSQKIHRPMDSGDSFPEPYQSDKKKAKTEPQPGPAAPSLSFPLQSPNSVFNLFRPGDLVYGLLKARNVVADELIKNGFRYVVANDLNESVVQHAVTGTKPVDGFSQRKNQHFQFLKRFKDYLKRKPTKPVPLMKDNPLVGGAFRRACKLLLINRELDRNYKTHMVTQRVDWRRVFDKKDTGVTNSEFRAAYRDYKKHGRNPFILFYDANNELMQQAPWEKPEIAPYFEAYDKQRAMKKGK